LVRGTAFASLTFELNETRCKVKYKQQSDDKLVQALGGCDFSAKQIEQPQAQCVLLSVLPPVIRWRTL
jgi:hypothetical protein